MGRRTIWKVGLSKRGGTQQVPMPKGAEVLHVGEQYDPKHDPDAVESLVASRQRFRTGGDPGLFMWIIFPTRNMKRSSQLRKYRVVKTGESVRRISRWQHVGTAVMDIGGAQVYHVFEV